MRVCHARKQTSDQVAFGLIGTGGCEPRKPCRVERVADHNIGFSRRQSTERRDLNRCGIARHSFIMRDQPLGEFLSTQGRHAERAGEVAFSAQFARKSKCILDLVGDWRHRCHAIDAARTRAGRKTHFPAIDLHHLGRGPCLLAVIFQSAHKAAINCRIENIHHSP